MGFCQNDPPRGEAWLTERIPPPAVSSTQTAIATASISDGIRGMQGVSREVEDALDAINQALGAIQDSATTVALAA